MRKRGRKGFFSRESLRTGIRGNREPGENTAELEKTLQNRLRRARCRTDSVENAAEQTQERRQQSRLRGEKAAEQTQEQKNWAEHVRRHGNLDGLLFTKSMDQR